MPDVSDERTASIPVQTVVEKNPVVDPMTAPQTIDIQDAPVQKPDSLDKKILSAAISAIGKVMGTAHGASKVIPVPVPLPVPLPLPKLMSIPAVPLSQYRYTYEERADIQFAAEEQARSSANSQAHLPEDIYSSFSVDNDAVSSGRIGGRTIHEQLPQRLETPIEQPGDTGNILIFPTLQEQLGQRLETPIERPGDTGNIMIFPVLAPAATMLYLRNASNQNSQNGSKKDSISSRLKDAQLPTEGRIRFVPPEKYFPTEPLPRGPNNGIFDKFKNEWVKGPSRTIGEDFEWDVQLSSSGKQKLGWLSRDGEHINVSLKGRITHR
jgi:hypothetical protein